jgi:hypothetical protein
MCCQDVRGSLSLYPTSFALSFTLVICNPKEEITTYLNFESVQSLSFSFLFFGDGPIKDAHHKRKEN